MSLNGLCHLCSTCFGHFYAHHQELETICVLLPYMVCDNLVAGCWMSGAAAGYASGMRDVARNIPHPERIADCPVPALQQPATKASHTIGGNTYSLEVLMMGIEVPETC